MFHSKLPWRLLFRVLYWLEKLVSDVWKTIRRRWLERRLWRSVSNINKDVKTKYEKFFDFCIYSIFRDSSDDENAKQQESNLTKFKS